MAFFVHGGGWNTGDAGADVSGFKHEMAQRGWLVISVEYTLANESLATWDVAESQVVCAMVRAVNNASALGGNPGRFVVLGESAGGNLALSISNQAAEDKLDPSCSGALPTVSAVVALYPGVNSYSGYEKESTLNIGRSSILQYTGGTPAEVPSRYDAVNSITHVMPSSPPTLTFQGLNNHIVAADDVDAYANAAKDGGAEVDYGRVPYVEHGFDSTPLGA